MGDERVSLGWRIWGQVLYRWRLSQDERLQGYVSYVVKCSLGVLSFFSVLLIGLTAILVITFLGSCAGNFREMLHFGHKILEGGHRGIRHTSQESYVEVSKIDRDE